MRCCSAPSFGGGDQRAPDPRRHRPTPSWRSTRCARGGAVRAGVGFGSSTACSMPRASRSDPRRALRAPRELDRGQHLTPYYIAEDRGPPPTTRWPSTWRPPRTATFRSATRSLWSPSSATRTTSSSAPCCSAPPRAGRRHLRRVHPRGGHAARGHGRQIQTVVAAADDGISQEELRPRGSRPRSPTTSRRSPASRPPPSCPSDVQEGFAFFSTIILVFGLIALLVGIFVIYNTFSIIVHQRPGVALLRAVGASRRQVLSAVIIEGVVVGLLGACSASASASCCPGLHLRASATTSPLVSPSP